MTSAQAEREGRFADYHAAVELYEGALLSLAAQCVAMKWAVASSTLRQLHVIGGYTLLPTSFNDSDGENIAPALRKLGAFRDAQAAAKLILAAASRF